MYKFHLVPLFSAIINLLLGSLVIATNPKRRLNQLFFGLGVVLAWWNAAAYFHANTHTVENSLKLFRIGAIGVALLPAALYHLVLEATDRKHSRRLLVLIYSCSILFTVLLLAGASMSSGVRQFGTMYRVTGNPSVWLFYLFFIATSVAAIVEATIALQTVHGPRRRLIKLAVMAVSILAIGVLHDGMHVLGLNYYPGTNTGILPLGTACASLYALILGYGLLSDQLLDFRISIGKFSATLLRVLFVLGIAYILLLSLAGILPGSFTDEGLFISLATFFVSTLVAVQFFPKLLGEYVDYFGRRISGDKFEKHDKIRAFIRDQGSTEPLADQVAQATILLLKQFEVCAVGIKIFAGEQQACCESTRTAGGNQNWPFVFDEKSALRHYFGKARRQYLDVRQGSQFSQEERDAHALLRTQSLVLAFPIGVDDRRPIGVLVVGERTDGRSLNKLDAELLALLCRHIAARAERIAVERNEELQRANQAKDQFLASVNHEIRNPLNGIHGIVQMLKECGLDERARYLLGTLQACTNQLRTTMDDVLDFNRLGPEVADNHPVQVDLVELARSTTSSYDLVGHQLKFEPVTCSLAEPGSQEPAISVWCDNGKFSHILMNYLTNALKYGVPSGATVRIRGEAIDGGMARVKLTVTSTGPTLSKEEVLSLFTPLTRGQRARETKAHGLGLGLALCKKLALAMGGSVGVESANGETTFWFAADLPISNPNNSEIPQPALHITPRLALAVEDEPYNRLVLGYHLNRFGITPVWAVDGQSALAAAQGRSFDLIVMDWVLPDMDGEILLTKLREFSPSHLPPVVVVSAYSTDNKRAAGAAAGAAAFVSKPIDESKLAEALVACKLGTPIAGPIDEPTPERIDLSMLKKANPDPGVVQSFLSGAQTLYTKLMSDWELNPQAAASWAHKLKGQLLLVRARDCADLLDLLERALVEGRHPDDIERLIDAVQHSFDGVTRSIRAAERLPSSNP